VSLPCTTILEHGHAILEQTLAQGGVPTTSPARYPGACRDICCQWCRQLSPEPGHRSSGGQLCSTLMYAPLCSPHPVLRPQYHFCTSNTNQQYWLLRQARPPLTAMLPDVTTSIYTATTLINHQMCSPPAVKLRHCSSPAVKWSPHHAPRAVQLRMHASD
jgi:hypothetical protein